VRDKVSNPCKTAEKIIVIYILVLVFLKVNGKVTINGMNGSRHSLNLLYSSFHLGCNFDFSVSFPNILTLPHFYRNYIYIYLHFDFVFHSVHRNFTHSCSSFIHHFFVQILEWGSSCNACEWCLNNFKNYMFGEQLFAFHR
jgi:hypothetical protein